MSIYGWFAGKGPSGFGYNSTAEEVSEGLDLRGKRYLVTGATSGIGFETARVLGLRGATVLTSARSEEKATAAFKGLQGTFVPVAIELSDPASIGSAVNRLNAEGQPLEGILCNAGIMALPKNEQKFGIELQLFTNHVGHFILVTGLLPRLSPTGRVVMVSSAAHLRAPAAGVELDNLSGARGYTPWGSYGPSKMANLLFARELGRRMAGSGQTANALHPGVIATNLTRHMSGMAQAAWSMAGPIALKTIPQGAATQTWALVHPDAGKLRGEYLADCNVATSNARGQDMALAGRLWTETERIVASLPGGDPL